MLRIVVLLLALANGAYLAWSQGLLRAWGLAPATPTEPQRLAQQIRPDALRIARSADERRTEPSVALAPGAVQCLQAGLYDEKQSAALRAVIGSALPAGSWSLDSAVLPARWIVYMGKYANEQAAAAKQAELQRRNVSFEPLGNAALAPGLSLGGYDTQAEAVRQLNALAQRGIRTARVVQEQPEARGQMLRLAAVDDPLRARLGLAPVQAALAGKALQPCP